MTTLSLTPFATDSFALATLEQGKTLPEILDLLPVRDVQQVQSLENDAQGLTVTVQISLSLTDSVQQLAELLEALEPHCSSVTVSLAVKVGQPTLA